MQVVVLVILYRGEAHITLHDDETCAWSELLGFVDDRWDGDPASASRAKPASADDLVQAFFADEGDAYMIGTADLSDVETRLCDEVYSSAYKKVG